MPSNIDLNYLDGVLKNLDLKVDGFENEVVEVCEEYKDRAGGHKFSNKFLVCASMYIVCKRRRMPRGMDEVTEAGGFNVHSESVTKDQRKVGRVWREVARILGEPIVPFITDDWIPRIVSLVNKKSEHEIGVEVEEKALELNEKMKEFMSFDGAKGGSPRASAAALVYISVILTGNEKVTQREMSDISGSTEVVIRENYQFIVDSLGIRDEVEKVVKFEPEVIE